MKTKNILRSILIIFMIVSAIFVFADIATCEFVDEEYYGVITTPSSDLPRINTLDENTVLVSYLSSTYSLDVVVGTTENNNISWKDINSIITFGGGTTLPHDTDIINSSNFIITYPNNTASYDIEVCIGTIINNNSTFSSKAKTNHGLMVKNSKIVMLTDSSFALVYSESTNSYAQIGTITAGVISFGSKYLVSQDINHLSIERIDDTNFLICFEDTSNSNYGTTKIGVVSGTVINFGSEYVFNSASTPYINSDINGSKCIISYVDSGNSNYVTSIIGDISGNVITFGSEYNFATTSASLDVGLFNNTNFVISYIASTGIKFVNATILGNIINYNTPINGFTYPYNMYFPKISIITEYRFINIYNTWGPGGTQGNSALWNATPDIPDIPDIPDTPDNDTTTNHTDDFNNLFTNLDTWSFIASIFGTYEIYCGATLFWLIIIIIPYLMMWIKQGSVIIPAIFALLSGSVLFALVPVEAIAPIKILLTIGIAGIFYHIIKSK